MAVRKITYTFRTPFTTYGNLKKLISYVSENTVKCIVETESNEKNITVSVSGENLTPADRQQIKMVIAKFVAQSEDSDKPKTETKSAIKCDGLIGINKP